jgi:hypothetical protein
VDQQFESDVMHDLMADSPTASADQAFEEDAYDDGFEEQGFEEDGMSDDMDQYDERGDAYFEQEEFEEEGFTESFEDDFSDEFAEEGMNLMDAMEEAVADAMDANDSNEFLRRLIGNIRGVAGAVRRGAGTVRSVAGGVQRVAGQVGRVAQGVQGLAGAVAGSGGQRRQRAGQRGTGQARPRAASGGAGLANLLQGLLPMLQQHAAQGANEMDVFDDLADWFEQEQADEALPIVAGVAARAALSPVIRRTGVAAGRAVNRQIVRGTTQAAQNLIRRQGTQAVRALRPIAVSVGRVAVRRGARPNTLPNAIRQATARVASQPTLARQLSQSTTPAARTGTTPRTRLTISGGGGGIPRRLVLNGPVEIIIRR